jgi:hypothetical protein
MAERLRELRAAEAEKRIPPQRTLDAATPLTENTAPGSELREER